MDDLFYSVLERRMEKYFCMCPKGFATIITTTGISTKHQFRGVHTNAHHTFQFFMYKIRQNHKSLHNYAQTF